MSVNGDHVGILKEEVVARCKVISSHYFRLERLSNITKKHQNSRYSNRTIPALPLALHQSRRCFGTGSSHLISVTFRYYFRICPRSKCISFTFII